MKKILEIEITCNDNTFKRKILIEEKSIVGGKNFKSKIFGTSIQEIFLSDKVYRLHSNQKIIWYNKPIAIRILFDNKLILNTNKKEYKIFNKFLKFNSSSKSKRNFAKILYYLSEISESDLLFEKLDFKFSKEVSLILKSITQEDIESLGKNYSDYQIAILCKGMETSEPRLIAENYFKTGSWNEKNSEIARNYVKFAIKKYGIEFIDFCLKLPSKPSKLSNTKQVFSQFEKVKLEEPIVRLKLGNTSIKLSYKKENIQILNNNINIGNITRNGNFTITKKTKNYNTILAIIIQFSENPLKQILFYGAETGKCSFCGLNLKHPNSLALNYGKICAKNYNLPWN